MCRHPHPLLFPPVNFRSRRSSYRTLGKEKRGEEVKFDYREVNTRGSPLSVSFSLAVSLAGASSSLSSSSSWADVPLRIPRRTTSTYSLNIYGEQFVKTITFRICLIFCEKGILRWIMCTFERVFFFFFGGGPLRVYCCWIKNFKTDYLGFLGFLGECCIMCVSRFRGSSVTSLGSVPA